MKNQLPVNVVKLSGESVPFDEEKLRHSLERSGASRSDIETILAGIREELFEGIPTRTIYKKAFSMLRKKSRSFAARYKLKKAIFELGPTGFPFEQYVGELLRYQGYEVKVGVFVEGHCVKHEIDVEAIKDNRHFMVECKFHRDETRKCDVKVPLYIHSRFLDVKKAWEKLPAHSEKFHEGWIFTNTGFTQDAIDFGTCVGLKLVGWDFPQKGSLRERIDVAGLHPVTSLNSITKKEKQFLLDHKLVLSKSVPDHKDLLQEMRLSPQRMRKLMEEINDLCSLRE